MTEVAFEMYRDGEWIPVSHQPDVEVTVASDQITVSLHAGHIQPPWRILRDGEIVFERAT